MNPRTLLSLIILFFAGAPGALAQKAPKLPKNDPSLCPHCHGDPEIMKAAGIVSHGGFTVGRKTTEEVDKQLGTAEIYWIETKHFELGMALGRMKVKQEDKQKLRDECALLAEHL